MRSPVTLNSIWTPESKDKTTTLCALCALFWATILRTVGVRVVTVGNILKWVLIMDLDLLNLPWPKGRPVKEGAVGVLVCHLFQKAYHVQALRPYSRVVHGQLAA